MRRQRKGGSKIGLELEENRRGEERRGEREKGEEVKAQVQGGVGGKGKYWAKSSKLKKGKHTNVT